jgi:hypothetical protein
MNPTSQGNENEYLKNERNANIPYELMSLGSIQMGFVVYYLNWAQLQQLFATITYNSIQIKSTSNQM